MLANANRFLLTYKIGIAMNKTYETPQLDYIKSIHVPLYDEILQKIKSRYPKRTRKIYERAVSYTHL
ncbi:MAG: hypothetical protein F7B11_00575, partial [Caldisphaeraceae archaeon]|nr:hypothetical protein [Caldisphaeraceae archaeon]